MRRTICRRPRQHMIQCRHRSSVTNEVRFMVHIMGDSVSAPPTIICTERGLTIAGTRTTLYDIMDYLKADWPPSLIQHWLMLSESQMRDALAYIAAHRA